MTKKLPGWILVLAVIFTANMAYAQITLDITKDVESRTGIPITVTPFGGRAPVDVAKVIASDLQRTGKFSPQSAGAPSRYAVSGAVRRGGRHGYIVQFRLTEAQGQGNPLLNLSINASAKRLRPVAHYISDLIYERITGEKGVADTRIAFVAGGRGTWFLVVADADGQNPRVILRTRQPLMSPAWSPDGRRIAYVSFEGRRPQIIVQDVYSGVRQVVSAAPGINGAPSWSPDGRRLAVTLSKDGNPAIYAIDLSTLRAVRLTKHQSINTEAVWLPDGSIVFTSDRSGSPQLYRIGSRGGAARRITNTGDYNARPAVSPDGRHIAMVHRRGGRYHIAVLNLVNGQFQVLTPGGSYESPSFSPNGKFVIYSNGRRVEAVSLDGKIKQDFVLHGNVREPAWSPFSR
ncbi:MAG: Tol-Pal system beta propeller repeat protein TolB [Candidatus Contendobacter odensis]|uniref:Tol-Pal system protein TolB n=1 Tax=Candidatus Contendibacter odensensis TaxID=1400860 RepID=A0A2G6PG13_9GAMM|nr:MAG: Tol-Pal system beta propeller repeat protein TolB [Candidatus Contendobacter odensis]